MPVNTAWTSWTLAWPLAKKDLLARYRGSVAGLGWSLLAPLAMVAVYAAVFQGVFGARWGGAAAAAPAAPGIDYALRMFAGLMVFTGTAELANRAARLLQDHANLVKRVVFPLELLVRSLLLQSAVHLALHAALLALLLLAFGAGARVSWLWLPLGALWVLVLQLALAWTFAALGAYLRDLQHLLPPVFGGLLFLTPVFYPREAAPPVLRALLDLNPLTWPIEALRAAWFGGAVDPGPLAAAAAATLAALAAGRWLFARLRPGFADLL